MPTTPHGYWYTDGSVEMQANTISALEASSAEAALVANNNSRQVLSFKWATSGDRTAQTGMSEGDIGYQSDNDSWWFYDGASWQTLSERRETGTFQTPAMNQNTGTTTQITFATPFQQIPKVFVYGNSDTGTFSPRTKIDVSNVSATGFTLGYGNWTNANVPAQDVVWMAEGI